MSDHKETIEAAERTIRLARYVVDMAGEIEESRKALVEIEKLADQQRDRLVAKCADYDGASACRDMMVLARAALSRPPAPGREGGE